MSDAYQVDIDYTVHRLDGSWTAVITRSDKDKTPMALLQADTIKRLMAKVEMTLTYDVRGT